MATLGAYFTYQVKIQTDHRLIETGPYRRIRHPGYLGQLSCCSASASSL